MKLDVKYELSRIQAELKVPKGQINKFGNYKYRSCEDILEAVKAVKGECSILLNDEVKLIGDRYYVEASASLVYGDTAVSVKASAREPEIKKGMDSSQITGTASSYARKYALNGLFAIDDTKDADTQDNTKEGAQEPMTHEKSRKVNPASEKQVSYVKMLLDKNSIPYTDEQMKELTFDQAQATIKKYGEK